MDSKNFRELTEVYSSIYSFQEEVEQLDELTAAQQQKKDDAAAAVRMQDLERRGGQLGMMQRTLRRTFSNTPRGKAKIAQDTASDKATEARARQAGARAVGQYYSSTTGKDYSSYSAALKDPKVAKSANVSAGPDRFEREKERLKGVGNPPTPTPAAQLPSSTPPAAKPALTPAAAKPAPSGQTGDKAKDMATWAKANPKLAAKVTPSGTQMGTGKSTMAKQADDLRRLRPAATQTGPQAQSTLPGGNYSPAATAKMSQRTKNILGVKEEYDAYDLVLEYLLSQGHVDTLEEALYVMLEMDAEVIQDIVEETRRTEYLQKKFNKENEKKSGSALKHIPGKQNTGQALQKSRESERQMRGDK